MNKDLIIAFAVSFLTFVIILVSKIFGITWPEIVGIVVGIWALGLAVLQVVKSNVSEKRSEFNTIENKITETEDRLTDLIESYRNDSEDKDKIHDSELKSIIRELSQLPYLIREHDNIKDDVSEIKRDLEQLRIVVAQFSQCVGSIKDKNVLEKTIVEEKVKLEDSLIRLIQRLDKLESHVNNVVNLVEK